VSVAASSDPPAARSTSPTCPRTSACARWRSSIPDLKRPYQWAFNAGITREIRPGLSATFEYFRSDFRDITMRINSLRTAASYDRVDVVSPIDGSVIRPTR
jgi:hypothetical protein